MHDVTMPPDLAAELQSIRRRLEALEMSARSAEARAGRDSRPRNAIPMYLAPDANDSSTNWPAGIHAGWTSSTSFVTIWSGYFRATGPTLDVAVRTWQDVGNNTLAVRLRVAEAGGGSWATVASSTTVGNVTLTGDIPAAALINPAGGDVANRYYVIELQICKTSGPGNVGVGFTRSPFNY